MMTVLPSALEFGSLPIGGSKELAFSVQNTGTGTLSGQVTVPVGFTVASGGTYSLAPGQIREVVVRFSPSERTEYNGKATFTGAAGAIRSVSGIGVEAAISLSLGGWDWIDYSSLSAQYKNPAAGFFENDSEGLRFFGDGYRSANYIHTDDPIDVTGKTLYIKWKATGAGTFMVMGPALTWAVPPEPGPIWRLASAHFSTGWSYNGSIVVTDGTWCFTRATFSTTGVITTTATGNYDDQGGAVIDRSTQSAPDSLTSGRILFYMADAYGGTNSTTTIGEVRLQARSAGLVILLSRPTADATVDHFRDLLTTNGIPFNELTASQVGAADLSSSVIIAGFSSEPSEFSYVAPQIAAAVAGGSALLTEGFGGFLLSYAGIGSAVVAHWSPMVHDTGAFVGPVDSSQLFDGIPSWDPPSPPDRPETYIGYVTTPGPLSGCNYTAPTSGVDLVHFWALSVTYGWPYLPTNSVYCQSWGGCTSERTVIDSSLRLIQHGTGRILAPINSPGVQAGAYKIGPVADTVFKNFILAGSSAKHIGELRLVGGTLAGQPVSASSWEVEVAAGAPITGTVQLQTNNTMGGSAIAPLGYTWTWGDRITSLVQVAASIGSGQQTWDVPVNLTAPNAPGTYYLVFAFNGELNLSQILSCTNWTVPAPGWNDGNDIVDIGSGQMATAQTLGYVPSWPYRYPDGFYPFDIPIAAIRLVVTVPTTESFTVTKTGTGVGLVTSSPAGIDCGATCTAAFTTGVVVSLTATAEVGSSFTGWDGEGCSGTGLCQVTMDQARSVTATFTSVPSSLSVNRSSLYFGATSGGAIKTSGQAVTVDFAGGAAVAWTATPNNSFIQVTSGSGTGAGAFTVSITSGSYSAPSTLNGSVTVSAPGASNSPQTVAVTFKVYTAGSVPFGVVDTPADNLQGVIGSLGVTGWALDDIEVTKVDIWRDPMAGEAVYPNGLVYLGDAVFIAGVRPDVEAAYPGRPFGYRAGWGFMILTNMLPNQGNGTFRITAYAYDRDGHTTLLGRRTITCTNATATIPFGAIDTPGQGATVSGSGYVNFGWALAPQPNGIPVDGSTIMVYIDGVAVGHPVYNNYRSDIATLFPGLVNSNGAVGYYVIDTTAMSNGLHNIEWGVVDDHGNATGIGSRFFWVLN